MSAPGNQSGRDSQSLNLTTGGLTLLGVLLSIGVTVGFGISGAAWLRVLVGVATTIVLMVIVKLGTSSGQGPIAQIADWVIGAPDDSSER